MPEKYEVRLCRGCIKDLTEHYPYLVPRDQLRVVEVPEEECDNANLDGYNERLRQRNPTFFDTQRLGKEESV